MEKTKPRESTIEKRLIAEVKKAGGITFKLVSPGTAGIPDRVVILPGGRVYFVEVKAPGKLPRPLQIRQMTRIQDIGGVCAVVDGYDSIHQVLSGWLLR